MAPPKINTTKFWLHPEFGNDEEETPLLLEMAEEALRFVRAFRWAPPIESLHLAFGVGKVIALFLVTFERPIPNTKDKQLWVVVGDLPSVYMVTDYTKPNEALAAYCELMEDWATAVLKNGDLSKCYPVPVAPTVELAQKLKDRTEFIRTEFVPIANERPDP